MSKKKKRKMLSEFVALASIVIQIADILIANYRNEIMAILYNIQEGGATMPVWSIINTIACISWIVTAISLHCLEKSEKKKKRKKGKRKK